jgi:hypothetical protein
MRQLRAKKGKNDLAMPNGTEAPGLDVLTAVSQKNKELRA